MSYWIKSPEWANAVISSKDGQEFYVSQWGGISARQRVGYSEVDNDASADMIVPHEWTLVATRKAPWAGEGLPPVGLEVEARFPKSILTRWTRFTLMYLSDQVLVYKTINEFACEPAAFESQCVEFRPIRTPEQIAAEEREKAITDIENIISAYADLRDAAKHLYDLEGYRKQPTDQ